MEIKNSVVKTELIEWRKAQWLQGSLKEMSAVNYEKLKESLVKNNFIMPFNVWQEGSKVWILDGHHRQKVMQLLEQEGYKIPDKLPANFINCKDKKDAFNKLLVYSSIYAKITDDGLYELISTNELNFDELSQQIDLPNINLEYFKEYYLDDKQTEEKEAMPEITGDITDTRRVLIIFKDEMEEEEFYSIMQLQQGVIAREYSEVRERLLQLTKVE